MTRIFDIVGKIERRILINYRVDPDVLARVVPAPFRPEIVNGAGVAGICLIRMGQMRPRGMPAVVGFRTENAAHRVAIEWDGPTGPRRGVYIPRRDTSSRLTTMVGGRLFPGEHYRARFDVHEGAGNYRVAYSSCDEQVGASVSASSVDALPPGSIFSTLDEVSAFFEFAPVGFSATRRSGCYEGLELRTNAWSIEPLKVDDVTSSFFLDSIRFPSGTVEFDSALLMHDIPVTWTALSSVSAN